MNPAPPAWPRLSSALFYDDPFAAIDWLVRAFAFEVRIKVVADDGTLRHSELVYGESVVMVSASAKKGAERMAFARSPRALGGANTQALMLYVDDAKAHCERARAAGAVIVAEPKVSDYGEEHWADIGYEAEDLEGHHWWFQQRLRTGAVT